MDVRSSKEFPSSSGRSRLGAGCSDQRLQPWYHLIHIVVFATEKRPLAFRSATLVRVWFADGGERIAIKARGPQRLFCGRSPSGYAFLFTMDTNFHRARIASETPSRNAAHGTANLAGSYTARPAVVFPGVKR